MFHVEHFRHMPRTLGRSGRLKLIFHPIVTALFQFQSQRFIAGLDDPAVDHDMDTSGAM